MYVAALSYGKDSIAMLEVIHRLGLPLDRVVTVDEWATDTLQALLPEVVEFQHKADVKIYDRYGIAVEHVRSPHTFESLFYGIMSDRSNRAGEIRGWPFQRGCWANSFLKIEPFRKAIGRGDGQYIGIAANETLRIKHHFNVSKKRTVKMPLVMLDGRKKIVTSGVRKTICFPRCIRSSSGMDVGFAATILWKDNVGCARNIRNYGNSC